MAISYQSRVRRSGKRFTATVRQDDISISATRPTKNLAEAWAKRVQTEIVRATEYGYPFDRKKWRRYGRQPTLAEMWGDYQALELAKNPDSDPSPRVDWTVSRAFKHYLDTVTPTKKGTKAETGRIRLWQQRPLAAMRLCDLKPADVQDHVDARRTAGRAAPTVRNEVFLLSALCTHAAKKPTPRRRAQRTDGWGLVALKNPVDAVELPPLPAPRSRRLEDALEPNGAGEEERMLEALRAGLDGELMGSLFILAVETGMRRSELLGVRARHIHVVRGIWFISLADSKNGEPRSIVLTERAQAEVKKLLPAARPGDQLLIPLKPEAVSNRWRAARKRAKADDLRLHDCRHEGLSRMADDGLNIMELQGQGGQKTTQILMGYLQQRLANIARKRGLAAAMDRGLPHSGPADSSPTSAGPQGQDAAGAAPAAVDDLRIRVAEFARQFGWGEGVPLSLCFGPVTLTIAPAGG